MLDFDRDVIREPRKFSVQRFHKSYGVPYTVEKIRVAKGDVLGPGGNLLANILKHHFAVHHTEYAVVDRNDRAVAAKMLASPARFRVTRDAVFA